MTGEPRRSRYRVRGHELAKRLKAARLEKGYSQQELGDRIGNPSGQAYISRLEAGAVLQPEDRYLIGLARELGIPYEELKALSAAAALGEVKADLEYIEERVRAYQGRRAEIALLLKDVGEDDLETLHFYVQTLTTKERERRERLDARKAKRQR
jgi:transcriptional regulator with XRE-family HTH domain